MTDDRWQVRRLFRPVARRTVGWLAAGLMVLFWLGVLANPLWLIVLFLVLVGAWAWLNDLPWVTVVLFDEGLEVRRSGQWSAYDWHDIRGALVLPEGLSVDVAGQRVVIDHHLQDWEQLRDVVLRHCPVQTAAEVESEIILEPEQLEAWLGVEPHGRLVCRRGVLIRGVWLLLPVMVVLTVVVLHHDWVGSGGLLSGWLITLAELVRNRRWR